MKNITLEMSLKPFKKVDDESIALVCRTMFEQWKTLLKDAEMVSVMFWTSDGSEILEYDGELSREFEWCHYIGGANHRQRWNQEIDPQKVGLHSRNYEYMENAPIMTYGTLKRIITILKKVGKEVLGDKRIRVGETFDPGPEFAKSDFKYNRHNEICVGDTMGQKSFVSCYGVLHGDDVRYAAYPEGIPEGTFFGTFFGKQCQIFLSDMGFDYIWFSNGFGFGTEPWWNYGATYDGKKFYAERLAEVKKHILDFWKLFREACPDFPIETRGTNFTCGIDIASDGVPLKEIYDEVKGVMPPINGPFAALRGDFGLELIGNLSRIAEIPGEDYTFRYYLHDPWWANSPWYDRYEGQPHDIYLPMATARIDEHGKTVAPGYLNILTVDNSYGDMPERCVYEVMPHLQKALKDVPDEPSPVVWVYPFREYNSCKDAWDMEKVFLEDWFARDLINNGFPMSSVVSTDNFVKIMQKTAELFAGRVLVSPVPEADSLYETEILRYIERGGRVLFYGTVSRAGQKFLDFINVERTAPTDRILEAEFYNTLDHCGKTSLVCMPGIDTVLKTEDSEVEAFASAKQYVIATKGKGFVWLRATLSGSHISGNEEADNRKEYEKGALLAREALATLGVSIGFTKLDACHQNPAIMVNRSDQGFLFSVYTPNTTVGTKMKFPLGAPLLLGYETELINGFATYRFPRADHRECRVFIEQEKGVVACKEFPPISYHMRRRIQVNGLENATVRFFPEAYTKDVHVIVNGVYPFCVGKFFEGGLITDENGTYYEVRNVTGTVMFSLPKKNEDI